jgi:high-affinity nickel-transport protein
VIQTIKRVFEDKHGNLSHSIAWLYVFLIVFNIVIWSWAFVAFHHYPLLMGTGLLAYSFGLRHAVDADHIAAIDNVTRKLMQTGKRPITVGLLFSLGHSTIVILASAGIAATAMKFRTQVGSFKEIGSLVGTLVSTFFLFAIAVMNLAILRSVIRSFRRVQEGKTYVVEDFDLLLTNRGFLARIFRPIFRLITREWHMYFLGFLFGLGFDTATEVGLLGISAAGSAHGMPIWSILVFPLLFTAGMTLIDTTDSILMLGAYGWALVKPVRKLYYNMTITSISVVVALLVGTVEGLGLVTDRLQLHGRFWDWITSLNDNFGLIGYMIVAVFIVSWLLSAVVYKWTRIEEFDSRIEQARAAENQTTV